MEATMKAALLECIEILEIGNASQNAYLTRKPSFTSTSSIDVYPVILAFLVGFIISKRDTGILSLIHEFRSCVSSHNLRIFKSWMRFSTSSTPQPTTKSMVDQAVQTQYDAPGEDSQEEGTLVDQSFELSDERSNTPGEDTPEPEADQDEYQAIELDDLGDLEGQIYDGGHKQVLPLSAVEVISEDRVLTSMVSVLLKLYGDRVPDTCTPGQPSMARTKESNEYLLKKSGRFKFPRRAYTNGDFTTSRAQKDGLEMEERLKYLICRYAAGNGHKSLLDKHISGIPRMEYFGLFKLVIDKKDLSMFQLLLGRISPKDRDPLEERDPEYNLPAVLEYAALRRRFDMMEELLAVGVDPDGDKTTHPLSAAIAGGSTNCVKLLVEYGANNNENRKSIVKEYTQSPIVIAARHRNVDMIEYLTSEEFAETKLQAGQDALSIAVIDRRAAMILCLMKGGITFTTSGPPIEKALETAVVQGDAELTELLLEAGADPNAEERYFYTENYYEGPMTFYGTLFQYACCTGMEDIVQAFLEHGVDFDKPIQSWINRYHKKPIYAAWTCKQTQIIPLILEYFDEADLTQFACSVVQKGQWFMFEHCIEYDSVKSQASWLLKKCLARLQELSEKGRFPTLPNTGFVRILHALIKAGAWLPPDTTWNLSSKVLFWLGYMSLDEFLAAVKSGENMQTAISIKVMEIGYIKEEQA